MAKVSEKDFISGLVKRGMPHYAAVAFTANGIQESGLDTGINERAPLVKGSRGGFGTMQWTGPRRRQLEAFAQKNGKPVDDLDVQLDFLMWETQNTERAAYSKILKAGSAAGAASAVSAAFLRPSKAHANNKRRVAEAQRLAGEPIDTSMVADGSYTTPEFDGSMAEVSASAARVASVDPAANQFGVDLTDIASTSNTAFTTNREIKAQEEAAANAEGPSLWDGWATARDEMWVHNAIGQMIGVSGFTEDPEFLKTGISEGLWSEITNGLPPEYTEVLTGAVSEEHARVLAQSAQESYKNDQIMAQLGWTGVALNLGAAFTDPVAILASIGTEGLAAPVIYGEKVTKLGRFIRAGAVAGATNVALDSAVIAADPVGQWEGLAYSAAAGFLLGGAFGAIKSPSPVDGELRKPMADFVRSVDNKEAQSIGAARVPGTGDRSVSEVLEDRFADAPKSAMGKVRYDMVGVGKQAESNIVRQFFNIIDEDAVGNQGHAVAMATVQEQTQRFTKNLEVSFREEYEPAFTAWAKERGVRLQSIADPAVRAEFSSAVAKAVRREIAQTENPHVARAATRIKQLHAQLKEFAKEKNVRGFDQIKDNDNYFSRVFNQRAIGDLISKGVREGDITQMLRDAILKGNAKVRNVAYRMTDEDALAMAGSYLKSIRSRRYTGFIGQQGLMGHDVDTLRMMLDDASVPADQVERIIDKVRLSHDSSDVGREGFAKFRMSLDETVTKDVFLPDGTKRTISIEDLLDNDAESVFLHYSRSVTATGFFEEAFSKFKVPDADGNLPAHSPSFGQIKEWARQEMTRKNVDIEKGDAYLRLMDTLYNAVRGIPNDENTKFNSFLRRMRDFNFTRVMNQVGVAQLSEIGNIIGQGGFKALMQHGSALPAMIRQRRMTDELGSELEAFFSTGMDILRFSPSVHIDDTSGAALGQGMATTLGQRTDYILQQGKKVTATVSGMMHVNRTLQRLNARVLVQRFVDHAHGSRSINARRFAALGIDDAMADRITAQIKSKVSTYDGLLGKKAQKINIQDWDDLDARDAFINAVDRWSRRSIQENNPGNMPAIMTKELGKSLFQFRSFMLASYTKQLLSGIHHRDWETFSTFMTSMFFGGLAYYGQTVINSVGKPDREAWLDDKLSTESIAAAAFQRAGFSSFIPTAFESVRPIFSDEPVFSFRNTELRSDLLGNPSLDLIASGYDALSGLASAAAREDYDYSQDNWRDASSLVPFQNAFGIRNVLAAIGGNLPKYSQ